MCFINKLMRILFGEKEDNNQEESSSSSQSSVSPDVVTPIVGKKRALCFGINDYPGSGNDLRGCLNDVADWSNLLKDVYKFDEVSNILNSNCTRETIKMAMEEIIALSMPNDVLVISYSGHGTYVADRDGDEIDGKDEAICLYDGLLIDDEIKEIMSKIKDDVRTTIIFDSCFSGTATRAFNFNEDSFYRVSRFMPSKDNGKIVCVKTKGRIFRAFEEKDMKEILISGCSDTEVSYDAQFGGKYYGAMSYSATRVLKKNPNVTYAEFYKALREELPSSQYPQTPQLECREEYKSRFMFS